MSSSHGSEKASEESPAFTPQAYSPAEGEGAHPTTPPSPAIAPAAATAVPVPPQPVVNDTVDLDDVELKEVNETQRPVSPPAFAAPGDNVVANATKQISSSGTSTPGTTAAGANVVSPTKPSDVVAMSKSSISKQPSDPNAQSGSSTTPNAAQAADGGGHIGMTFGDDQGAEPTPEDYNPLSKWWALSLEHIFTLVQLNDPLSGVDSADAPHHAQALGNNVIPIKGGRSWVWILASQFMNAITVVLLIVIVISGVFQDWAEFGVVLFVLLANAFLGFYQEYGAEKSLESLKQMTAGVATVLRNGEPAIIFVDEVVVGDVVILEQGASVPADCRVFESNGMEVDEALLTGEALPVVKHANVIPDPDNRLALGDRKNMVYRSTTVSQGRGKAVVVAGGVQTEMGKLAKRLGDTKSSGKTPLMKKLDYLMYVLFAICIVLAVIVFAANKMKYDPSTLSYATAVAIAILPESLSAVVTVSMTVSVKRMAQQKCIVRKLAVLEVLGGVTDICSDKTGTLTENKMVVKKAVLGLGEVYSVTGAPYDVHGDFIPYNDVGVAGEAFNMGSHLKEHKHLYEYFRCCALCSTTILHISDEDQDSLAGSGNPTEVAIQVMTWKAQLYRDVFENEGWVCVAEYAFDSTIKRMSTAWYNEEKKELYMCTKGAPERVIKLCNHRMEKDGSIVPLTDEDRKTVEQRISDLAEQGLRTICFSFRADATKLFPVPPSRPFGEVYKRDQTETDLVYLGIVGIYDPPRPESRPSIVACQHAGIRVRMLTGDHTSTAGSIAAMLNIISHRDIQDPVKLQAGPDFDNIDNDVVDGWEDLPWVVGRCSPDSKVKMIESLHRRKKVVAMTGDGFNDSPSIKIADVGCAMGSGVDVTKGVADLVITDDNFATIVKAVAEGRRISQCISKFVVHLLSSNVAEVIALICALPIRSEGVALYVLSPIEILWLNMITSSPPAIGLSLDAPTADVLQVPPNRKGLFTPELVADTFVYGFWLGVVTLMGFVLILFGFDDGPHGTNCNNHRGEGCYATWSARCTAFGILYFGLLIHAYTVRHTRLSLFKMTFLDNKWICGALIVGTILFPPIVYINPIAHALFVHHMITWQWGVLAVAVIIFVAFCELHKVLKNCFFPIKRALTVVDDQDDAQLRQEYHTFTRTTEDQRNVSEIAEEHLRMSFASLADGVPTAGTASFRMPEGHRSKKKKSIFGRKKR